MAMNDNTPEKKTPDQAIPAPVSLENSTTGVKSASDSQPGAVSPLHCLFAKGKAEITPNRFAVLGLLVLLAAALFPIIKIFFVPVVVAATLATLFYPLYRRVLKFFGNNRGISSLVFCILLLACLIAPTFVVVNIVVKQATSLYQTAQPVVKEIVDKGGQTDFLVRVRKIPLVKRLELSNINMAGTLYEGIKMLATGATRLFNKTSTGVLEFVANVFVMFFTMFYFFMDGEKIVKKIGHLIPIRQKYKEQIVKRFLMISRAAIMGTAVIGITQGTLGALLLLFCGVKSWLMWGFVMILLATIPMLGSWTVLIPTGIIQIIYGNITPGIIILAVSMFGISSVDNLIRPRLVGQGAKLHDLVIFFSSLGGIAVFGILGFIVGPVIAALFVAVLDIYSQEFEQQLDTTGETSK